MLIVIILIFNFECFKLLLIFNIYVNCIILIILYNFFVILFEHLLFIIAINI